MTKIDLANFVSFKKALLASVDYRARILLCGCHEGVLRLMYQHALTADAMKRLQPPGRTRVLIELVPGDSSPLQKCWEAFLIWNKHDWRELDPPGTQQFSGGTYKVETGVEPVEQKSILDTRLPPKKLFIPIPKAEIGGCARSDSLAPAI